MENLFKWKFLAIIIIVLLLFIGLIWSYNHYEMYNIKNNWEEYRDKNLNKYSKKIQSKLSDMERNSFRLLENLLKKTSIVSDMTISYNNEGQTKLFSTLLNFNLPNNYVDRGIAIYDGAKKCIAWKGWVFNISPYWLEECIKGTRFSTIAQSEERVYAVLCSFVPVKHPQLKEYIGVAVTFLPLYTNYPLSNRYIKSKSFAEEMLFKCNVQSIKIDFKNDNNFSKNAFVYPLQNLNGDVIGKSIISPFPQDVVIKRMIKDRNTNIEMLLGIFTTLIALFFIIKIYFFSISSYLKSFISIFILIFCRYIFLELNFPLHFLDNEFKAPDVFYSLIFGKFSGVLGNLITTAIIFYSISIIWIKYCHALSFPLKKYLILYFLLLSGLFISFFIISFNILNNIIESIVFHSNFDIFNFNEFIPSFKVISVYIAIFFFGISINFFNMWFIKNLNKNLPFKRFLSLSFIISFIIFIQLSNNTSFIFILSNLFFLLANFIMIYFFSNRDKIRWVLFLVLISLSFYCTISKAFYEKKRILIEDKAEEYKEQFIGDAIEQSLDIFESKSSIIKYIEKNRHDSAFLLWANSKPLSERLDNLSIMVYIKGKSDDNKIKNFKKMTWQKSPNDTYFLLSEFSLNMPPFHWYFPLISKLNPSERKLLKNIPGYSEGRNMLFYIGGVPIFDEKDNQIAFVVIFTRHQKIAETLPLPEVFINKKINEDSSIIKAFFDGQILIDTNNPYMSKYFKPTDSVIENVYKDDKNLWVIETIEEKTYNNFYFPQVIKKLIYDGKENKILTQKRIVMIGFPSLSWNFRIFYFLQFFIVGIIFFFLPLLIYRFIKFCFSSKINKWYFSYEQKILISFLIISGIPVFIMGIMIKEEAVQKILNSYKKNLTDYLKNAEKSLKEDKFLPIDSQELTDMMPDDEFCKSWGERNHQILNVYLSHALRATNRRELFQTELLPKRMPGNVFFNLILLRKDIYVTLESLADYKFIVGYKALTSPQDKTEIIGTFSIPMIYEQEEVKKEISEVIGTVFNIYAGIFIMVFFIGTFLAHQITRPLARLIEGIHKVSEGNLDFNIPVASKDEFGQLVTSFNKMTYDLKISRKKLIEAEKDAAWREMARQIAHEIKNPLTPIKLSAQHILRTYNDKAPEFDKIIVKGIKTIISSIDSLSKTASSFSEFAKFIKPIMGKHDILQILDECILLFSNYKDKGIHIETHLEKVPLVKIDPHQIKRVIINIFTNAIHAIEAENGKILVYCKLEDKKVKIIIKDNGVGIPDNLKHRLFEPNFSTKSYGSGLGLAISKRSIEQMNGKIFIESEHGKGTEVNIFLRIFENNA